MNPTTHTCLGILPDLIHSTLPLKLERDIYIYILIYNTLLAYTCIASLPYRHFFTVCNTHTHVYMCANRVFTTGEVINEFEC